MRPRKDSRLVVRSFSIAFRVAFAVLLFAQLLLTAACSGNRKPSSAPPPSGCRSNGGWPPGMAPGSTAR